MHMIRIVVSSLFIAALAGCGGGGAKVTNTSVTDGQQLIDLKKAYDEGLLTEKEYEQRRKKVLKG